MKNVQRRLLFLSIFSIIGFITLQIPFNKLAGSNVSFTLFDFFGPIAGAFLGPWFGIVSVLTVEFLNYAIKQTPFTTGAIIRLFPMLFGVYYFATVNKKSSQKWILAVPVLSMIIFLAHPIGRSVWYYSLFWLIPLLTYFKRNMLLSRSLGATFAAHSVGGAAWIWAFNLPANVWNSLIPVVIVERLLFALGISASYLLVRFTLAFLVRKKILPNLKHISPAL